jgi:hypothetical protein
MLTFAICLFALAATLGLVVATALFKRKETPKPVVAAHGLAGVSALVVLFLYAQQQPHRLLNIAMTLFAMGAVGGLVLLTNDLRRKPGPLFLVVVHAGVAVIALTLVLLVAFG